MSATPASPVPEPRSAAPRFEVGDEPPHRSRRTLGRCAHCHQPVALSDDYVRLYRRAWHLDCALAAGPRQPN